MAIFLMIDGITGNVTAKGYEGAIAITSLQHRFTQHVSMPIGRIQDRVRSAPEFSELILTKSMDSSTNTLLSHAFSGQVIPEVSCHITTTDDQLSATAKYRFKQVIISRYETAAGAQGRPMETLSLHFTQIETTYLERDPTHASTSPQVTAYNLETAEVM